MRKPSSKNTALLAAAVSLLFTASAQAVEGVTWVEPDQVVSATDIPNDSRFSELWAMHNSSQTGGAADADCDAPEAWNILKNSAVLVAVVDTAKQPDTTCGGKENTAQ